MALQYNLIMGQLAVNFVRRTGVRANNLPDADKMPDREWNELTRCIGDSPDSVRAQFGAFCNGSDPTACLQQHVDNIDRLAQLAGQKHCGNCTEQDALAITFLKNARVRPLDLMNLMNYNGIDHTFVVIGRIANSTDPAWATLPQSRLQGSIDTDPTTWGPDAVVCDPWHNLGMVYPAAEIQTTMFRGYQNVRGALQPESIWRLD